MSDIKEINPHPNGWEYVIEDFPVDPTPKNRPSAILFNWMIKAINNLEVLLKPTNWIIIPLAEGVSTSYAPRVRKSGNVVEVNGIVIYNWSASDGYVDMGFVPEGLRPNRTIRFAGLNQQHPMLVQILPTGVIQIANKSGVPVGSWTTVGCTYIID